ncbi:serine/threonine-protein kinase [Aspergillus lucknowensis]|uniref:non-specific serine/threonine protein kinase n=1 Tax=Aspergillus lucknowensis TaxID=176173 RepID=A0ABR4M4L2_9EURO
MEATTHSLDSRMMRSPLTDVSNRVNNCRTPTTERGSIGDEYLLTPPVPMSIVNSPLSPRNDPGKNSPSQAVDSRTGSKRNSAASTVSGKGKRKTHVGPWQLGRTLGSGATGRVRLAKHAVTSQTAAIKIVSKKCAAISQSDSIAAMDKSAGNFTGTGARQMPSGIEREVVIMKLIEHPNVISLYDVWENRGELYLVLEYVEGGELFDYVSNNGPLPEEEAVRLFRQVIAGLGYCHRFNICHRDLKPENILLDGDHNVKLADFGMAALQPAGHWLNTSCGSPHYAAPEIIYGRKYRGDKADIWSCGIILYALLTGFLPFDGGDLHTTLQLVRKGDYMIPPNVSDEAADLIQRILQKKPDDRISMREMWKHPLLTKYEKFHQAICNHHLGPAPPLSAQDCGPPVVKQDIDVDLLRNLQTLWHDVKPEQLIERLLSLEPTHERMFYHALVRFRNEQLENYQGQPLKYSASDYHHISRGQARLSKHLRSRAQGSQRHSQVPVVKETGKRRPSTREPRSSCTVESYDPFRSPFGGVPERSPQYARVTIHRDVPAASPKQVQAGNTQPSDPFLDEAQVEIDCQQSPPFRVVRKKRLRVNSVKSFQSKASRSGSRRGLNYVSTPRSVSYKRGVSFRHSRNRSQSSISVKAKRVGAVSRRLPSEGSLISVLEDDPFSDSQGSPALPAQPTVVRGARVAIKNSAHRRVQQSDIIWKDDARKVSHELSRICEEAFNGSSLSTGCTDTTCVEPGTPATSVSIASAAGSEHQKDRSMSPRTRGDLPSPPYASKELEETRRRSIKHSTKDGSKDIPRYLGRVINHLDRLIEQEKTRWPDGIAKKEAHCSMSDLPCKRSLEHSLKSEELHVAPGKLDSVENDNRRRQVSNSTAASSNRSDTSRGKRSIRMVPRSSFQSIDSAEPVAVGKTCAASERYNGNIAGDCDNHSASRATPFNPKYCRNLCELDPIDEHPASPRRGAIRSSEHKKWSWFRKSQNIEESVGKVPKVVKPLHPSSATVVVHAIRPPTDTPLAEEDRPRFREVPSGLQRGSFWKFMKIKVNRKTELEPAATKPRLERSPENEQLKHNKSSKSRGRCFEGRSNNWFARVFQFKPATRVLSLNASKMKGRKEVYKILREWKQYGIEDLRLDKANSIIHGRVGETNFLHLRPVEFSAEFYTVIEDGRQANLSLVRFRQERGAASSFNKVVDTLCMVMKQQGLLVEDPARARKMAQVLDAFPNT